MKTMNWITCTVLVLLSHVGLAQYQGPTSTKLYTVTQIKENASQLDKSDALVKIIGYVVDRIDDDTYWFKDNSGRIQVEIENDQIPDFPFDDKTKLVIVGEVDYDVLEEVEVEVEFIQLAK